MGGLRKEIRSSARDRTAVEEGKGKRESVWSREESEERWAHTGGYGQGGEDVSRGNGGRKGNNDESGRDIFTGEPGEKTTPTRTPNRGKHIQNHGYGQVDSPAWTAKRVLAKGRKGQDTAGANMARVLARHGLVSHRGKSGGGDWQNPET